MIGEPRLLLLGLPEHFGSVPDGMTFIPISCQSDGAMEVYIEPVLATPHLVVVGRSPMAHTLCDLAMALGWRSNLIDAAEFTADDVDASAIVVVATQGHGDEDAIGTAATAQPAYVGLVASRNAVKRCSDISPIAAYRRGARLVFARRRVGLDLGHTSHREIAVAVLAELVQLRVAGDVALPQRSAAAAPAMPATVIDAVCGMTVQADRTSHPLEARRCDLLLLQHGVPRSRSRRIRLPTCPRTPDADQGTTSRLPSRSTRCGRSSTTSPGRRVLCPVPN